MQVTTTMPIGLFDSGVGGLTVLASLKERLPHENYLYLGDTARVPYGTKSLETIIQYSTQATAALLERGIKLLVIACNTATASLPSLQKTFPDLPIIGVVGPGARGAAAATCNKKVIVLATQATVNNRLYHKAVQALAPEVAVTGVPGSLLVSLAEEGWAAELASDPTKNRSIAESIVAKYLAPTFPHINAEGHPAETATPMENLPDTLVLGCTHFPPYGPAIARLLGDRVTLINPAVYTAEDVEQTLAARHQLNVQKEKGTLHFLTTGTTQRFAQIGSGFLGSTITPADVEQVALGE